MHDVDEQLGRYHALPALDLHHVGGLPRVSEVNAGGLEKGQDQAKGLGATAGVVPVIYLESKNIFLLLIVGAGAIIIKAVTLHLLLDKGFWRAPQEKLHL